jgi:hypothetical protein
VRRVQKARGRSDEIALQLDPQADLLERFPLDARDES